NDGVTVIDTGTLKGIDNQVDPTTGTLKLKAEFPNGKYQLWPGQFVNVRPKVETLLKAVVVPTSAVQRGPIGTFSYVIDSDNVAHAKPITVAQQNETDAVIANGLTQDDRVVTTGFANLADGSKVIIGSNDQTPSADLAPRKKASRDPRKDGQAKDGQAKDGQGKDGQGKDGEHRKRGERGEGDQKGATGPAGGESSAGAAKSQRGGPRERARAIMSASDPFIRRPIATSLLGIALLIGGMLGYFALPVSALPQVDFPTVQVTTQLPGASPDVIASLITAPLERQLGQIPSLSSMNSTSSFGVSQISLQFDLNRDIDGAPQAVPAAINAAAGVLPRTLPYPPVYAKVNPADAPVMTLALTSETISLRAMSDIADTVLSQRLSQISGVGKVTILGGLKPAVRVQADLARLAANDQIPPAEAYKPIIIAYRNGNPVTIGDVAQIVDGLENDRTGGWYQGTPAVVIDIQRQPGATVIEVVRQIRAEIPKLQRTIPAGVNLTIVSDRTVTIRASVRDVQFTLILAAVLVTLVVLLFLRSIRATIIAGVALPLSLITSFGIMYFAGFSLDNLSLMALTIGTGFVVDDAIV